eukprot:gene8484-biopygen7152
MPGSGSGRLRPPGLTFLSKKTERPDLMDSGGGASFLVGHVTVPRGERGWGPPGRNQKGKGTQGRELRHPRRGTQQGSSDIPGGKPEFPVAHSKGQQLGGFLVEMGHFRRSGTRNVSNWASWQNVALLKMGKVGHFVSDGTPRGSSSIGERRGARAAAQRLPPLHGGGTAAQDLPRPRLGSLRGSWFPARQRVPAPC